jgi:Kdo-III transferase WaaZ
MFLDGGLWEGFRRRLYYRLCKPPRHWHNREYSPRQEIECTSDGRFIVRWPGHEEVQALSLKHLRPVGDSAAIIASGPSIQRLADPVRLFHTPAACANGSISLAVALGVRVAYYVVSDSDFIEQQPQLFQQGIELADAIILNPKTVFTAMLLMPGLLKGRPTFLREDMRYPFKGPRLGGKQVLSDPRVVAHRNGDRAFSLEPADGTYPGGTVAYDAVQILFGIGYHRLYLFGMDLTSSGRFYPEGAPSPSRLDRDYHDRILPSFELVRTYCRQTGRRLINCSLDSRLPAAVVPKMDGSEGLRQLMEEPVHLAAA